MVVGNRGQAAPRGGGRAARGGGRGGRGGGGGGVAGSWARRPPRGWGGRGRVPGPRAARGGRRRGGASEARMNQPGRASGSWRWRMREGALTRELARRLRAATEEAGRR